MNMKGDTIVLYPAMGSGHLVSMVELGKLILTHHPSLSITILILSPPNNNQQHTPSTTTTTATAFSHDATSQYITDVSSAMPSITFHNIPLPPIPATVPPHLHTLELSHLGNQHVHRALRSFSKTTNLRAVILDFFNFKTIQFTLDIPTFFYYTSGVSTLAVLLNFPTLHKNTTKPIKDLHMHLQIPGLPPMPTDDFPDNSKDPENPIYHVTLELAKTMRNSFGIIANTFDAIEEKAIKAITEGLCVPDGNTPPLFCIGPLISTTYGGDEKGCLSWLDSQPSQSVVLLCFGSMGRFSRTQLSEIAHGLERSEQRFLWVVRTESGRGDSEEEEPSLDELLPEGFLERTKEKGMVVRDWAPQGAILSHNSVGGFVTHCGWNSVLEAVCEGVPMVAWPLYAEQKLNRVIMVQEMKVALAVNESKDGLVSSTELGDRVRELMDSDRGKEIRQRIFKMKMSAVEARSEGGSSPNALNRLAHLWNTNVMI
ncbi:isoflavone 7-O-glucosyltransferase 1 [Lotus japonicus]|uniref:isoflavone 7-O-glucosyltransferase 1 n=1 Tax=Lotus japonicus TaxID=34305 RepID=UPI0025859F2E|nr:isoflavone 7-O-glucosyltransferase 1 [Lotus japonicus]